MLIVITTESKFYHRMEKPLFQFGESGPEKVNKPIACIYHESKFIVSDLDKNALKVFDKTAREVFVQYKRRRPG